MKLPRQTYKWAIDHLARESDTDLFPRPFELTIIEEMEVELLDILAGVEIEDYHWHEGRRFPVPKDNTSIRMATQLHLMDSILLGAITYQFGSLIESGRVPEETVYSYRFRPSADGRLYANKDAWVKFWKASKAEFDNPEGPPLRHFGAVLTCDISDFYNQTSLRLIKNRLVELQLPEEAISAIMNMLKSQDAGSGRGVPVGPHATHLLAELVLQAVDQDLLSKGVHFRRYIDDYHIFCDTEKQARGRISQLASLLDRQDRLSLQRSKIVIYKTGNEFLRYCGRMLAEQVDHEAENEIIEIIRAYAGEDSYVKIKLEDVKDEDLKILSKENISNLLDAYLKEQNFEKLRWFFRRLSQVGIPHAVDYAIENFEELAPAVNDICLYINSCAEHYKSDWKEFGSDVLELLDDELVKNNDFFQISLLNLFVYNSGLNHTQKLIELFNGPSSPVVKRKVLLACMNAPSAGPWLEAIAANYRNFDGWTRQAYLIACKSLSEEKRQRIYQKIPRHENEIMETIIRSWAKKL